MINEFLGISWSPEAKERSLVRHKWTGWTIFSNWIQTSDSSG